MAPPLSPAPLEWVRHCFQYNDATFFYPHKLPTTEIADLAQCNVKTIQRLRKLWNKTGDVERLSRQGCRPRKIQDLLEQAVIQLFIDHVDLAIEEALEWLKEEFFIEVCKKTISNVLRNHNITHKRLKFVAAQPNPELRADYLIRIKGITAEQLVFLDESTANEFTKDRKTGWSLKGCPAVKERDFRRSERWSILPAYTRDGWLGILLQGRRAGQGQPPLQRSHSSPRLQLQAPLNKVLLRPIFVRYSQSIQDNPSLENSSKDTIVSLLDAKIPLRYASVRVSGISCSAEKRLSYGMML
jgi:transposase